MPPTSLPITSGSQTISDEAGNRGYGTVTKLLHWGIFFLMVGQFLVGYLLEHLDDEVTSLATSLFLSPSPSTSAW